MTWRNDTRMHQDQAETPGVPEERPGSRYVIIQASHAPLHTQQQLPTWLCRDLQILLGMGWQDNGAAVAHMDVGFGQPLRAFAADPDIALDVVPLWHLGSSSRHSARRLFCLQIANRSA